MIDSVTYYYTVSKEDGNDNGVNTPPISVFPFKVPSGNLEKGKTYTLGSKPTGCVGNFKKMMVQSWSYEWTVCLCYLTTPWRRGQARVATGRKRSGI